MTWLLVFCLWMFPKYFSHLAPPPPSHAPPNASLSPPPPPPLLWSCLNNTSAAAELLQLARKSKERSEIGPESLKSSSPSPSRQSPAPVSVAGISPFKPMLKFSVNAILSRDASPECEDQKPVIHPNRSPSPSHAPVTRFSPPPLHLSSHSVSSPIVSSVSSPPSPSYIPVSVSGVTRPFLPHPILPPHLHPLLYQQAALPRTGFTLPGSGTTFFPLPGTFPWSSGFRGIKRKVFYSFSIKHNHFV